MKTTYDPETVRRHVPREAPPGEVRAAYLRPGELLARMDAFPVAYAPMGTLEWHGRQNPLGCDALKAEALCMAAAGEGGGVVMPPFYFAMDMHWDTGNGLALGMDPVAGFMLPGSFYQIEPPLFLAVVENACRNYLARGFQMVVLVSGHNPPVQLTMLNAVCAKFLTPQGREPVTALFEFGTMGGHPLNIPDHAGFYETSLMMHLTDRVNPAANDGQDIPELAIGTERPLNEAAAAYGAEIIKTQTKTLCEYVKRKYGELTQ
jgi:creatinine amidohydrolase